MSHTKPDRVVLEVDLAARAVSPLSSRAPAKTRRSRPGNPGFVKADWRQDRGVYGRQALMRCSARPTAPAHAGRQKAHRRRNAIYPVAALVLRAPRKPPRAPSPTPASSPPVNASPRPASKASSRAKSAASDSVRRRRTSSSACPAPSNTSHGAIIESSHAPASTDARVSTPSRSIRSRTAFSRPRSADSPPPVPLRGPPKASRNSRTLDGNAAGDSITRLANSGALQ